MAAGWCITARSSSASSAIAASACTNPSAPPVDLWITLRGYPQPHRPNRHNNRHEQIRKTVTQVAGQICYLCCRLLTLPDLPCQRGCESQSLFDQTCSRPSKAVRMVYNATSDLLAPGDGV